MKPIEQLKTMVILLNLERDPEFDRAEHRSIAAIYNGCGPEWSPSWVRRQLTSRFQLFEEAFLIHDWDFAYAEKTRDDFLEANRRMLRNCKKLTGGVPWWLRPVLYVDAHILYWSVSSRAGWEAFCDA